MRRKRKHTVLTGSGVAEDNGLNADLDLPLRPRLTLSANYSDSFRLAENSIGVTLTLQLRNPAPSR